MSNTNIINSMTNNDSIIIGGENGFKLRPYQKEILDLQKHNNDIWKYLLVWPRASGKDALSLFLCFYWCMQYTGYTCLYLHTTKLKALEVASKFFSLLLGDVNSKGLIKSKNNDGIYFFNGSSILFVAAIVTGLNIRGLTFQTAVLSEIGYYNIGCIELLNAAIMPRLELSKKSDKRKHFLLLNSTTSNSRFFNYIYNDFIKNEKTSYISRKTVYELYDSNNERLYSDEYLGELRLKYDNYVFNTEFLVEIQKNSDYPLHEYAEKIIIKDIDFQSRALSLAVDWGRDCFCGVFGELVDGWMLVYSYIYDSNKSIRQYVSRVFNHTRLYNIQLSNIVLPFDTAFRFMSLNDSDRGLDSINAFIESGFVKPIIFTKQTIDSRLESLRRYTSKTVLNTGCDYIHDCLANYSFKRKDKSYTHCVDAISLLSSFFNSYYEKPKSNKIRIRRKISFGDRVNDKLNNYYRV